MTRPLLVGIGNPWRGDDGIGWAVAEAAGRRLGDAVDVVWCDGEPTRLLDAWADADFVVVVDAARTGAAPGTVHLWTEGLPTTSVSSAGGSHALGIAYAVALGHALHRVPQRLAVIGIEAGELDTGEALSTDVAAAVDLTVELLARLVVGRVVA
ncbi:MAG: hydrogenase maturation protease [Actinobacteria bacterium]|nr:MAG: hydrogenase maturation protease [Actinomycetota bacterium]